MRLLTRNGKLLGHGDGLTLLGSEPSDFLYLTYFSDIRSISGGYVDKPLIGPETEYTGTVRELNTKLPASTEFPYYNSYPCIYPSGISTYSEYIRNIFNTKDTISVEVIQYVISLGGHWSNLTFTSSNDQSYFGAGINYWNTNRGRSLYFPGYVSTEEQPKIQPGYYEAYYDGKSSTAVLNSDSVLRRKLGISHYAHVIDYKKNEVRGYIDGVLAAVQPNANGIFAAKDFYRVYLDTWGATNARFTQFCIRRGDRSINSGLNYPVPETPYRSF